MNRIKIALLGFGMSGLIAPTHSYATDNKTYELYKKCAIETVEKHIDSTSKTYKTDTGTFFKTSRFYMTQTHLNGASIDVMISKDNEHAAFGRIQLEHDGVTAIAEIPNMANASVDASHFSFQESSRMPMKSAPQNVEAMKQTRAIVSTFSMCIHL